MGVRATQVVAEVLTGASYSGFAVKQLPTTPNVRTASYQGTINVPLFGAPYSMPGNNQQFFQSRNWPVSTEYAKGEGNGMLTSLLAYLANPFLLSEYSYNIGGAGSSNGFTSMWSAGFLYVQPTTGKNVIRIPAPLGKIVNYKPPFPSSIDPTAAGSLTKAMYETIDWTIPSPSFEQPFVTVGGYCINGSYLSLFYFDTLSKLGQSGTRLQPGWYNSNGWNGLFASMDVLGYDPNWVPPPGSRGGLGNIYVWLNKGEAAYQTLLDYRLQQWNYIHLDNAAIEAGWNGAVTKYIKPTPFGWLIQIAVNVGYGPYVYLLMSYDGTKYWILNLYSQGKGVPSVQSVKGDAFIDANGIFYYQDTQSGELATSYGSDFPLMPAVLGGYAPSITLPCLDYCPAFDISDMPQL